MRADGDRLRRIALLLAILTIPALIFSGQLYVGYHSQSIDVPFIAFFTLQACHWYLWAIAAPIVWRLAIRWPVTGPRRVAGILRHAVAALATGALIVSAYIGINETARHLSVLDPWFRELPRSFSDNALFLFVSLFHVELLVYAGIVALAYAVSSMAALREKERDALRLASALATARLQALRAQLQPHFLFNTLNTIGSLVLQGRNDRAVGMIAELGDLLRTTLDRREADLVPLRDEIAQLRRYVRIEEARFGDRLRVRWDIAGAAEPALVPAFVLQPIVENAFRHGVAHRTDIARLDIQAVADAGALRIRIYNDGPPLPDGWSLAAAEGFGLRNVVDRLQVRDSTSRVTLENTGSTGVTTTLVLPLRVEAR
jgi:two-component system, LytTR family, sensor kinase